MADSKSPIPDVNRNSKEILAGAKDGPQARYVCRAQVIAHWARISSGVFPAKAIWRILVAEKKMRMSYWNFARLVKEHRTFLAAEEAKRQAEVANEPGFKAPTSMAQRTKESAASSNPGPGFELIRGQWVPEEDIIRPGQSRRSGVMAPPAARPPRRPQPRNYDENGLLDTSVPQKTRTEIIFGFDSPEAVEQRRWLEEGRLRGEAILSKSQVGSPGKS